MALLCFSRYVDPRVRHLHHTAHQGKFLHWRQILHKCSDVKRAQQRHSVARGTISKLQQVADHLHHLDAKEYRGASLEFVIVEITDVAYYLLCNSGLQTVSTPSAFTLNQ
eukprot:4361010-Amphidinium_carterae.1